MKDMFIQREGAYDFRDGNRLVMKPFKKMKYGRCTFSYYGVHIWNMLPTEYKENVKIEDFKKMLSIWEGPSCKCSLCDFVP